MGNDNEVIIVGGGAAGLTAAAYLSRAGVKALLLERGKKPGGLVNTFWHQGFAFDGGIRAFENSGIILPMLRRLGIDLHFVKNPVTLGIGDQEIRLDGKESLASYGDLLRSLFPENREDIGKILAVIEKVMGHMDVLYGIDNPLFEENLQDPEYLRKTLLPWLGRYHVNIRKARRYQEPVNSYLRRFTANERLIDLITQHFFKNTPAFFALSYFSQYLDYNYPQGGTGILTEKLAEYVLEHGGEIQTESAVLEVDAKKREVRTKEGTFSYQKLIWAADQKTLYENLQGIRRSSVEHHREKLKEAVGGDSILTVYVGTDLPPAYVQEHGGAHSFYTPSLEGLSSLKPWKEAQEGKLNDWVKSFLERTTFEISCPVLRDSALAPEGKTGLLLSTLMDYNLVREYEEKGRYEELKSLCTTTILQILSQHHFPGLQDKALFAFCSTPLTILKETGNAQGAITGWAFTGDIPAEHRFTKIKKAINTPIPHVYQCGQWTFSPAGLPVSILTGKVAAEAVMKELKTERM